MQLGAKKTGGLGAQKAKKTFAEIEKEAEIADQMKVRIEEERQADEAKRVEDEATATANMKLAYQVWPIIFCTLTYCAFGCYVRKTAIKTTIF